MKSHSIDIRVYYEDTDAGGVVFYGNYLKFAERGRTEFLRAIDVENKQVHDELGLLFVVRALKADYYLPAHLDDMLRLTTSVERIGGASLDMKQIVTKNDEKIFEMDVTLVCVDTNTKPKKWPSFIKERMNGE
jgi:acyl-CoA thioester hydrolase|tara:strand:- start:276 stop:674 length:399 start_codon:yes stop_codon:yes gene_type:complete